MAASPFEIWKVDLDAVVESYGGYAAQLDHVTSADKDRLHRMQDELGRARRAAAWIALRKAAEKALGVSTGWLEIDRDVHGKPVVTSHALDVSLAHAGHLGLIGISRAGAIGVDLDRVRAVSLSASRRAHLIALGIALADEAPVPEPQSEAGFVQAWTRIEAVAKARGDGLARLLGETRRDAKPDTLFVAHDVDLGIEGFRAAVAVPRAEKDQTRLAPRWFGPAAIPEFNGSS